MSDNKRIELESKIVALQGTLSRVTVDRSSAITLELKNLMKELMDMPPEVIEAGDVYLNSKVSYEGSKYKIVNFKGKLYFYEGDECSGLQKIDVDEKGVPTKVTIRRRNSDTRGLFKEYVYHLKIDQEEPQAPRGVPYKLKFSDDWVCNYCLKPNQLVISGEGKERTICEHCRIDKLTGKIVNYNDM
jgi:hypothetical protein